VVCFIFAECQMLLLPLDVGNYRSSSDIYMNIFWYIIYCTSAVFIVLILPFGIFFYETDEEKEFVRSLTSLKSLIEMEIVDWSQI
jgi:hypothetical protein